MDRWIKEKVREAGEVLDSSPVLRKALEDGYWENEHHPKFRRDAGFIGVKAAEIEAKLGKEGVGAGLFFIRMFSEGVPWRIAEQKLLEGRVPELREWREKHAEQWKKAIKEEKRLS